MPFIDGFEATRLIRQFNTNVVIIAITCMQSKSKEFFLYEDLMTIF